MKKTVVKSQDMLDWQYKQILAQLDQLQLHAGDPDCPCRLADMGEYCLSKHSLLLVSLAQETAAMDGHNAEMFYQLRDEADEKHRNLKAAVCGGGKDEDVVSWARGWRKRLEPLYYSCSASMHEPPVNTAVIAKKLKVVKVSRSANGKIPTVKILGTCKAETAIFAENEYGYPLCQNSLGEISRGPLSHGEAHHVNIKLRCPDGTGLVGVHHLHPGGSLRLSEMDKISARQHGLIFVCVEGNKKVKCYRFRK